MHKKIALGSLRNSMTHVLYVLMKCYLETGLLVPIEDRILERWPCSGTSLTEYIDISTVIASKAGVAIRVSWPLEICGDGQQITMFLGSRQTDARARHYFTYSPCKQKSKTTAEKTDTSCKTEKHCGLSSSVKPIHG